MRGDWTILIETIFYQSFYSLPYSPTSDPDKPAKALLFDSWYDKFRGAVCNIALIDGMLKTGM
jgi:translation elongation factor EF-4